MKVISSYQAYSIDAIIGNCIISKTGEISFVYGIKDPECYSLSKEDIEHRQKEYARAFGHITNGIVHRQDIYLRESFDSSDMPRGTFISEAEARHFDGREYARHIALLSFTISGLKSLSASYIKNPLAYKEALTKEDKARLSLFIDEVDSAVSILRSLPRTEVSKLYEWSITEAVFSMVNGFHTDTGLRDVLFEEKIHISGKKCSVIALCDENYLPDTVTPATRDTTLGDNSELSMSMLEPLGLHLRCTHIVNQIWKFRGNYYNEQLKNRVAVFGRHRSFDKDIEKRYHELSNLDDELREEQKKLCEYHYNLMIIEEEEDVLNAQIDKAKSLLTNLGYNFYIPSFEGLYKIFVGSIIGRSTNMDSSYFMLTDLDVALCQSPTYTLPISDEEGVYFQDRVYQVPLKVDVWDRAKKRIPARNAIVIASTGGGKSVTTLNVAQQLLENDVKLVIVEFGKSFYQLGQLYPERSLHIDYDSTTPLGINPFFIESGTAPSKDKIRTLVNLVLVFWRMKSISEDTPQVVSLTKIVQSYYDTVHTEHSFPSFYHYVKEGGEQLLDELSIDRDFFDLKSFLHNCSEFLEGGYYENVCKPSENESLIAQKDVIIFELTRIKKDPFLVSVIMSILYDTIESKILADRSVRGMLIFDEYAESQAIKDQHSGTDIHSTVAFCYQKLRKENGAIMTIVQTPSQLPDNEYTRGIISNTQIVYVLPTTNVVYNDIETMFKFQNPAKENLMRSIKNNFSGKRKYSEVFISLGEKDFKVVRLELSPEKFLAYQTDGETWQELQELSEGSTLENAITQYLKK